ncbi:hypothetical protein Sjap_013262 [Stephania japonica]|uniref:Aminotransferase-like plant mobile domain-containing protein n=1 Tax=Stephania japonica TaxID=461633 RepID=A0AAP0IYS6_9MAGN
MAFYSDCPKYMEVVEPYHPERFIRQLGHVQGMPPSPYRLLEANQGHIIMKYSVKYLFQSENWERWRSHSLSIEDLWEKARFEFMAAPEYLSWFTRVVHPTIENPAHSDDFTDTVGENELLERNRRALDNVLAWIDLSTGMEKMEATEKMANDVVDYLTGRGLGTSTTTTTTNTTTPSAPTAPLQHDSTPTENVPTPSSIEPFVINNAPCPPQVLTSRKRGSPLRQHMLVARRRKKKASSEKICCCLSCSFGIV